MCFHYLCTERWQSFVQLYSLTFSFFLQVIEVHISFQYWNHIHAHTHICTHAYNCMNMHHICTHAYKCMHMHKHTHTHTFPNRCKRRCLHCLRVVAISSDTSSDTPLGAKVGNSIRTTMTMVYVHTHESITFTSKKHTIQTVHLSNTEDYISSTSTQSL